MKNKVRSRRSPLCLIFIFFKVHFLVGMSIWIVTRWKSEFTDAGVFAPVRYWKNHSLKDCAISSTMLSWLWRFRPFNCPKWLAFGNWCMMYWDVLGPFALGRKTFAFICSWCGAGMWSAWLCLRRQTVTTTTRGCYKAMPCVSVRNLFRYKHVFALFLHNNLCWRFVLNFGMGWFFSMFGHGCVTVSSLLYWHPVLYYRGPSHIRFTDNRYFNGRDCGKISPGFHSWTFDCTSRQSRLEGRLFLLLVRW